MVKMCGNNPPETLLLGDFLDEIYEKDLVAEGYNTKGRLMQANYMDSFMQQLQAEMKVQGYNVSNAIDPYFTFDARGKPVKNYDPNGNGRRLEHDSARNLGL